jgi:hypothetical protein
MDTVRRCTQEDLPAVAGLFQKIFRREPNSSPLSLQSYLKEVYFENPWYDESIASLVYESDGVIAGFVGSFPFPFRLNGSRIMAVLAGNLMVDPGKRNSMAATRLLKQLFAGPQDATMTDTSTDNARKLWEALGCATIHTYSLQWFRLLRPARFSAFLATRMSSALAPLELISRPLSSAIDGLLRMPSASHFRVPESGLADDELTIEILLDGIDKFCREKSLVPAYDQRFLQWLLDKANEKREFGAMRKVSLYNGARSLVGWYLYYPNPGKVGQVLQCAARPRAESEVLRHLLNDALAHGSLALMGRFDPQMVRELSLLNSVFTNRGSHVQAYCKKAELIHALQSGDAFFSRLEGEWWTRLQGDRFE